MEEAGGGNLEVRVPSSPLLPFFPPTSLSCFRSAQDEGRKGGRREGGNEGRKADEGRQMKEDHGRKERRRRKKNEGRKEDRGRKEDEGKKEGCDQGATERLRAC